MMAFKMMVQISVVVTTLGQRLGLTSVIAISLDLLKLPGLSWLLLPGNPMMEDVEAVSGMKASRL
jgi:hypothetical protein